MNRQQTPDDDLRLLSLESVRAMTGLSASTIYKGAGQGWFPRPRKIGPRSARWLESEIRAWVRELPQVEYAAPRAA